MAVPCLHCYQQRTRVPVVPQSCQRLVLPVFGILAILNINNLRYADDTTLMAESEEELKSLLMKVKEESWLKAQHSENEDHGIWFHHFMGNRWGNSGNSVRLYFGGHQNHCRW